MAGTAVSGGPNAEGLPVRYGQPVSEQPYERVLRAAGEMANAALGQRTPTLTRRGPLTRKVAAMSEWRKSSYCESGACVEVAWRKSSYSSDTANCVEVAPVADAVLLRDSKDPDGPVLTFTPAAWGAFVAGVRSGEMGPD